MRNILDNLSPENKEEDQVKVIVSKNEHFSSMDSLHALDFEKVCEIKQGYLL